MQLSTKGNEAAYNEIYDGKWEHDNYMYVTFHRVAVAKEAAGKGVAQTFLQGLIEGEKGPISVAIRTRIIWSAQHLLEKLGYHYCGKVPIDGVRLKLQKIKRKANQSIPSGLRRRPLGSKKQRPTMTLYLKQFYESPMGLLSIIVSEEGLVELDFL